MLYTNIVIPMNEKLGKLLKIVRINSSYILFYSHTMIYNYSQDLNKYNIYKYKFYLINSSFILFYFLISYNFIIFYKIWTGIHIYIRILQVLIF